MTTRTAAHPRTAGPASSPTSRKTASHPRAAWVPTTVRPPTGRGPALHDRTALLGHPRPGADGPSEAPTVRLPVVGRAGGSGSRVRGIDAARGLALLGMIAVHSLPTSESGALTTVGLLAGGTSAALFALLVGVSVALLTGRRRVDLRGGVFESHAVRLAVRGLAVGLLGLALGEAALGDVDIILTYYGVLFLLAVPLILLPTRVLFALGAVIAVVAPVTSVLVRAQMPPTELIDPSFTALADDPAGLVGILFFTGAYPIWPWLTYLCVGIAVGRCSLTRTRTAAALAAGGVLLAGAAAAVSYLALVTAGGLGRILADPGLPAADLATALVEGPDGVTPPTTWWWLAVDTAHSSTPLDLAYTVGTSLAVLGAMLLLDRVLARGGSATWARIVGAARSPLAAAGSMTLTFYTLHVVVAGLASDAAPWALYLAQVAAALLVGLLWQRFVGRGPLEAGVGALVDAVATAPAPSSPVPASPAGLRPGTDRPRTERPWLSGLVAAVVLAVVVGGAFAVAATLPADPTSSAVSSEQVDDGADDTTAGSDQADPADATDTEDEPDQLGDESQADAVDDVDDEDG